ncbi:MAG: carbon-nitrogen hydrolase family protein [Planctomycetes bacterium]|nr:carbon-nitrogen hydrolase family protein [Planctomycetota bacterium]
MMPFAVAGVQMTVVIGDNMPRVREKLAFTMAVYPWVQMVVFSELAVFGPDTRLAQALPGPVEQELCELAKHYGIWLVPGSLYEHAEGGVIYNTTPVIAPDGTVVARHRKLFPFTPYEVGVKAGDTWVVFDVPEVGRFGVSICYDMWFPETSRSLACMGAEVLIHPSLTGTIDRDVELSIGRATAAQNQMFVFDINGCGVGGNGQSQVIAPTGEILYRAGRSEEVIPIEIDLDRVRRSREVGLRGLGQPLKSFRDREIEFPAYPKSEANLQQLQKLGPLAKPQRGSRAGIDLRGQ